MVASILLREIFLHVLHFIYVLVYVIFLISWHHGECTTTLDDMRTNYSETFVDFSESLPCRRAYNPDGQLHVLCEDIDKGLELNHLPAETTILEIHCEFSELNVTKLSLYRLEELILDRCSNLQLKDDVFLGTREIRKLVIRSTYDIADFRQVLKVISSLTKLKFLSLSKSSGFKRLQRSDLALLNTTSLEELEVSGCRIESVDRNAFEDLPMLKSLDFSSNPLSENAIGNITISLKDREIHTLALRQLSHIKDLPLSPFMQLKNSSIYQLDLSDNNIPKLQAKSFSYVHLKILKLANSKIGYIDPSAFQGSLKLEIMDLKKNFLISIDNQLDHVTELRIIDLSSQKLDEEKHAKFTVKENSLANLTNLEVLFLNEACLHGNITRLMFNGLVSLEKLELSRSNIENIADFAFESMETLQILDLSHNNIRKLNRNVFYNLENLTSLNLNWNKLTLEEREKDSNWTHAFSYLTSLQVLSLDHNSIRHLSRNVLKPLNKLQHLSMKYNKLKSWHDESFSRESAIRKLLLSHNEIETVSDAMLLDFSNLEKMETLDLSDNPFNCADCALYLFQNWVKKATRLHDQDFNAYGCATPVEYKGRSINEDVLYSHCESTTAIAVTSEIPKLFKENRTESVTAPMSWIIPISFASAGIIIISLSLITYHIYSSYKRKRTLDSMKFGTSLHI